MHNNISIAAWFISVVSPIVVMSIRTDAARRKATRTERAWKAAEKYILV
jgi:hypothetical protein